MRPAVVVCLLSAVSLAGCEPAAQSQSQARRDGAMITLPEPAVRGQTSVEEALARRRSLRRFSPDPLGHAELGQLLWAAQGVTGPAGHRTSPSAGATYPLELYAATDEAVYHYAAAEHALSRARGGDQRRALARAALDQEAVRDAATIIILTAVYARTEQRYGERAQRYVHVEAGHAAQNVLLQAVALGLGAVPIGAFDDRAVHRAAGLPADHRPLYLIPVGHP